jgi:hypothetical protein
MIDFITPTCAYYMRNTLREPTLGQGMIGRRDYNVLLEFKQLKAIVVAQDVLEDVYIIGTPTSFGEI